MATPTPVPRAKKPLWQFLAWLVVLGGIYDGGVLTFSPQRLFSSPSYFAAREVGLRPLGVVDLLIVCTLIYSLGNPTRQRLQLVLLAGFGYNVLWLCLLVFSWFTVGVGGPTSPSKAFVFAGVYLLLILRIDERRRT